MSSSRRRTILRGIAMGVPFVTALAAPFVLGCSCPQSESLSHVRQEVFDRIVDAEGNVDPARCAEICAQIDPFGPEHAWGCEAEPGGMGPRIRCHYTQHCGIGRRPPGYAASVGGEGAGAFLSNAAELEAASVIAFEMLARELAHHHAPDDLVRRALRAAGDEREHASLVGALAVGFGAAPRVFEGTNGPTRDLDEIALDNAREGLAGEAFGALVASVQAEHAPLAAVRGVFARIARDESAHALFSMDLAEWLDERIDAESRARAREAASLALATFGDAPLAGDEARWLLGLPDPAGARGLAALLSSSTAMNEVDSAARRA